mgnify:CR=1 FL=1
MKRRILSLGIALLTVFLLSTVAFAHSGRTDSKGGHYDHSTGEYHYHHGHPAHQHPGGQCPYVLEQEKQEKAQATFRIVIIVVVSTGIIIAALIHFRRRRKAKAESLRLARMRSLEEARQFQALRDSIPEFKSQINALWRDYIELQTSLLTEQVLSPRIIAKIPEDSFVDSTWLPHQFGASTLADDKYYFAFNESTSVIHRPSCTYADGLPLMNIMDITQSDDYCHPRRYSRPCQRCKPELPGTFWIRGYHDLVDALAFFGVTVEDLNYPGKPCNKLNPKKMIVYRYRIHGIALYGVESDVVSHIGYSRVGEILLVRMISTGRIYTYTGISPRVHKQFICAESIGRFYNQYIKRHPGSK